MKALKRVRLRFASSRSIPSDEDSSASNLLGSGPRKPTQVDRRVRRKVRKGKYPLMRHYQTSYLCGRLELNPGGEFGQWCRKHPSELSGPRREVAEDSTPVPISHLLRAAPEGGIDFPELSACSSRGQSALQWPQKNSMQRNARAG